MQYLLEYIISWFIINKIANGPLVKVRDSVTPERSLIVAISFAVPDRDESSEIVATVWLPIYSTDDRELFQSLVSNFFIIQDSCSTKCSSTAWSTFHPDPKSDILVGYDKTAEALI